MDVLIFAIAVILAGFLGYQIGFLHGATETASEFLKEFDNAGE